MGKKKKFKKASSKRGKRFAVSDIRPSTNYDLEKPVYSLKHMPYQGENCISNHESSKRALILDKLLKLSQFTWREIRNLPKKSGFEPIPRFRFDVALPPIFTPDVTILVARYDGDGGRIAGFRENDVFHVVLVGKELYSY